MMRGLDVAGTRDAIALFEPVPSRKDAERLAVLVGSWEELLAHLLLLRATLPGDIADAIRAASRSRGSAASPRPQGLDAIRLRETEDELAAAVAALTEAEASARAAGDALSAAFGAHAAERPVNGFDLHLRIAPRRP